MYIISIQHHTFKSSRDINFISHANIVKSIRRKLHWDQIIADVSVCDVIYVLNFLVKLRLSFLAQL